jgi:hypothetical protein
MYGTVVNTSTMYCDTRKLCVLSTRCVYAFHLILTIDNISLDRINRLVDVMKTRCIYCAVESEFLKII